MSRCSPVYRKKKKRNCSGFLKNSEKTGNNDSRFRQITAGRVEINHLPVESVHAPVYERDVFTVRGKGRFCLTALPGKSKKDRSIIEFFQY